MVEFNKILYVCADENDGFYPEDRTTPITKRYERDLIFDVGFNSLTDGRQFLRDLKAISSVCRVVSVKISDESSVYGSDSVIFANDFLK